MTCPLCNTEMRILATDYVTNEGKLYTRQTFTCRNKKCGNYGKEVKKVYTPLETVTDNEVEASE